MFALKVPKPAFPMPTKSPLIGVLGGDPEEVGGHLDLLLVVVSLWFASAAAVGDRDRDREQGDENRQNVPGRTGAD